MSIDIHLENKQLIARFRAALYDCDPKALQGQLHEVFAPDAAIHLAFPFEDLDGPDDLFEQAYQPLLAAIPDLERRDFLLMGGSDRGVNWVGCAGHYMGVFERPWLDIPPTRHLVAMRYHEFFRVEDGRVTEMQALWDIPQVMMQAGAWPLSPSLGVEWVIPGPAGQDGILTGPYDPDEAQASVQLVLDMVHGLGRSSEGMEAMKMEDFWHPRMNWYGPAGIGSMRRLWGFQTWHQFPFLRSMPDRRAILENGFMFGDGNFVAFTAWPGMGMTVTGDGWLGIAPGGQPLAMRSLDFWRREGDVLRENWVLVDILSIYDQLGVDVFSRMREITYARQPRG